MKTARKLFLVVCVALLCAAPLAQASTVTSAFSNFAYSYTVTPAAGETIRSFHIYLPTSEADASHYYNRIMPAGWLFDVVTIGSYSYIVWYTAGDPLPVGVATAFGFTHYCAPCCHSWFVAATGSTDPNVPVVDDDSLHSEACSIPAPFNDLCGGPGTIMAPIYPVAVPNDGETWGGIKAMFR